MTASYVSVCITFSLQKTVVAIFQEANCDQLQAIDCIIGYRGVS